LKRFGMRSISELRGRTVLLMHLDYTNDVEPIHEQRVIEKSYVPDSDSTKSCVYPTYLQGRGRRRLRRSRFCSTEPVAAVTFMRPSRQMHNRGNGKGGGMPR
jgi:hypothetical protein